MSEPINLGKFRKQTAQKQKKAKAAQNRAIHGQAKSERQRIGKLAVLEKNKIDGKKIDHDPDDK